MNRRRSELVADLSGWWLFIRRWEQGLEILGEGGAKEIHSSRAERGNLDFCEAEP